MTGLGHEFCGARLRVARQISTLNQLTYIFISYALYRRGDGASHPDAVESELFRRSFSWEPRAKFIGVWDTVGSLGVPVGGLLKLINKRWAFHDMTLSSWVDNAFQALAIDERRKPFQPSVWNRSANEQVLEQVWFAGVHSNIGGSYPQAGLSDISVLWMISKLHECGLAVDGACLQANSNPKPDPFGKLYDSQTLWYKLAGLGDYIRPIGAKAQESAASTAVERMNGSSSQYTPTNLDAYLKLASDGPDRKVIRQVREVVQGMVPTTKNRD